MKLTVKIVSILLIATMGFSACKKGENDPFISFKSRKARITGEWKAVKVDITNKHIPPLPSNSENITTKIYDGTTMSVNKTYYDFDISITKVDTSYTTSYSSLLEITKDGDYTYEITEGEEKNRTTGSWYWYDGNKSKVGIYLGGDLYNIDQLKDKEMILKRNYSYSNGSISGEYSLEIKFEKK